MEGVENAKRDLKETAGEFRFELLREKAAANGIAPADAAIYLRTAVFGTEATSFLGEDARTVPVRVEATESSVDSAEKILNLPLLSRNGVLRLREIASAELGNSVESINRIDKERSVRITANNRGRTVGEIVAEVEARFAEKNLLPEGYRVVFGGEQQQTVEAFTQLYYSMAYAIILIILILVAEFRSFGQTLLVFLTIPLGLIGVFFGMLIFGGNLNFSAFIGIVSLVGVVVNNAIILIDQANKNTAAGMDAVLAARSAAESRFRPVLLTTLTTTLGLLPLVFVSEFFRDLAITFMGGLAFSSVLTLILIPVLFVRRERRIALKKIRTA